MSFKCLRALPMPLATEHAGTDEILLTIPGEILSIPLHACPEEHNPGCQCRRVFVGLQSGQPTTLARVSTSAHDDFAHECDVNPKLVSYSETEPDEPGVILHSIQCIEKALTDFQPGTLLRIHRVKGQIFLEDTWKSAAERIAI